MDFSKLTNDQLVELVRSLCYEAVQRGQAVEQAVQAVMLSEAEKAQIAAQAAAREAQRLREAEAERIAREAAEKVRRETEAQRSQAEKEERHRKDRRIAAFCEAVYRVLGEHCTINLWAPKEQPALDNRLYIDGLSYPRSKICIYIDGNRKARPGSIEGRINSTPAVPALVELAKLAKAQWNPGLRADTKIYVGRDDLQRGGEYQAQYEPLLDAFDAASKAAEEAAEAKRQATQAEAERKAAEKAAADKRFIDEITPKLAPLRELAARYGCTEVRLFPSKLGGSHVDITFLPQHVTLRYQRYGVSTQGYSSELADSALNILKSLYSPLQEISDWQSSIITLTPLEASNA